MMKFVLGMAKESARLIKAYEKTIRIQRVAIAALCVLCVALGAVIIL